MNKLSSKDKALLQTLFELNSDSDVYNYAIFRNKHLLLILPFDRKHAIKALSIYQPQSLKARIYISIVRWFLLLNFCYFLPKVKLGSLNKIGKEIIRLDNSLGLLLGSANSIQRKIIAYHCIDDEILVTKIGIGEEVSRSVSSEYKRLIDVNERTLNAPEVVKKFYSVGKLAYFTVVWVEGSTPKQKDYIRVREVLVSWLENTRPTLLRDIKCWNLVSKSDDFFEEEVKLLNDEKAFKAPVHGDFAPWNIKINGNGDVHVLDWESYKPEGAAGWDWAHFYIQSKLLVDKMWPMEAVECAIYWAKSSEGVDFLKNCGWDDSLAWIGSYLLYAHIVLQFDRRELIECWKEIRKTSYL